MTMHKKASIDARAAPTAPSVGYYSITGSGGTTDTPMDGVFTKLHKMKAASCNTLFNVLI